MQQHATPLKGDHHRRRAVPEAPAPLSFLQERFWFSDQVAVQPQLYYSPSAFRFAMFARSATALSGAGAAVIAEAVAATDLRAE